jgi:hypothetical protein
MRNVKFCPIVGSRRDRCFATGADQCLISKLLRCVGFATRIRGRWISEVTTRGSRRRADNGTVDVDASGCQTADEVHELCYQPWSCFWTSVGASYGTGLRVELNGESTATFVEEFGQVVVDRVNLNAGRVRPSLSVDLSAALDRYKKESRAACLQCDIALLSDRLRFDY